MYLLLLLLSLNTFFIAAVSSATCQASLSVLTSNAAASSYCSSALASVTATSETVTSVVVVSKTTTDLDIATSTITIASTTSVVSEVVSTTYVASSAAAERHRRRRRAATTDTAAATSLLSTLDTSDLSAACSCINALPTGNAALRAAATTTITGEVWFTVGPVVTISTTRTISTTERTTVTLAAPTFDQVWGPKSGCAVISSYYTISYVNQLQTQDEIFQSCKDGCADEEDCAFLFIQNEYPNVSGLTSYWNCFYNNHALDESEDLDCTKNADEWGEMYGFDAVGRG